MRIYLRTRGRILYQIFRDIQKKIKKNKHNGRPELFISNNY